MRRIQEQAERLFSALGLRSWARFDGFVRADGSIIWSDLNAIPGFGQDSMFFQQAALWGFSHRSIARHVLSVSGCRIGLKMEFEASVGNQKEVVAVIGGGTTSEKQVSRMSWANVLVKLGFTGRHHIKPIYMSAGGSCYEVPMFVALQHTVEEIEAIISEPSAMLRALHAIASRKRGCTGTFQLHGSSSENFAPKRVSIEQVARESGYVFIALHGGYGEDGGLQAELDGLKARYNGSGPLVSSICMSKHRTSAALNELRIPGFRGPWNFEYPFRDALERLIPHKRLVGDAINRGETFRSLALRFDLSSFADRIRALGADWCARLSSANGLVFKPIGDGCSSGVFLWRRDEEELCAYFCAAITEVTSVPWAYFGGQYSGIPTEVRLRMPFRGEEQVLVEELHTRDGRGEPLELTVAVLGEAGYMCSLVPSETRKEFDILTLEEKFCKGVGVNVTPPPTLDAAAVGSIRERVSRFANKLGIEGYARIDVMYYPVGDELVLIEVNSLPGLSSATVTFTQALVTPEVHLAPSEFLEAIMSAKAPGAAM